MSSSIHITRKDVPFDKEQWEAFAQAQGVCYESRTRYDAVAYRVSPLVGRELPYISVTWNPARICLDVPWSSEIIPHCAELALKVIAAFPGSDYECAPEYRPYMSGGDAPLEGYLMTYRKLVAPEDMNPADRLFGGRIMQWADEAVALYAMCQMKTKNIVTLKVSEILFKNPAFRGDVLEFYTKNKKVGKSSLQVDCVVKRKTIPRPPIEINSVILQCDFTFVSVDKEGRPTPHGMEA